MAANLNDIYKTLGDLTRAVSNLAEKIDANERRNLDAINNADKSRSNMHRRFDDLANKTAHLETQMADVVQRVGDMQNVTDSVKAMTYKAQGAGTLGHWVIKAGGWVVSAAAGAAAVYTYFTGRPPP